MKNLLLNKKAIGRLSSLLLLSSIFIACGSYTDSSYNDGIYGGNDPYNEYEQEVRPQTYQENSSNYYQELFSQELEQTGVQQNDLIFTDVDGYSSDDYTQNNLEYDTDYRGEPAWGTNPSEIVINYYNGFIGYGNPFYQGYGFGGPGYPGYVGFGYRPFYGFTSYGYAFGPGWGYGFGGFYNSYSNPYWGGFYGGFAYQGTPYAYLRNPYLNNYGYYNNRVAYSNGFRSSVRNNNIGVNSRLSNVRSGDINTRGRTSTSTTSRRATTYPTPRSNGSVRSSQSRSTTTRRSTIPNTRSSQPAYSPSRSSNTRSSNPSPSRSSGTVRPSSGGRSSSGTSSGRSSSTGRSSGRRG